jgi:H+/Cl- antiporter ClcA
VGLVLINQDYWLPVTKSGLFYLSVAVGVLGGILTGAGMGRDYAYKIEGKKPEELKNILKELCSEARLTNVQ